MRVFIAENGILTRTEQNSDYNILPHEDLRQDGSLTNWRNFDGHGTFVAGVIAAITNNNKGIAGINWNTAINQVGGIGSGIPGAVAGINSAISQGAEVLNMSYGMPYDSFAVDFSLGRACADAYKSNMLLVAWIGNAGTDGLLYPAALPWVMAVGATNRQGDRPLYSNYGSHISVVAPGGNYVNSNTDVNIYSTDVNHWVVSTWHPGEPGWWERINYARGVYGWRGGTSFSTPHVVGLASLIKGYGKTWGMNLDNEDLRHIIEFTADDIGDPGYDIRTGYGKINAQRALEMMVTENSLYRSVAYSGAIASYTTDPAYVYFYNTPGLPNGQYFAKRYEITKTICFPRYYTSLPYVWGRGIGSNGLRPDLFYNYGIPFTEVVPGTCTNTSVTLRTYIFKVYNYPYPTFKGWYPFEDPANAVFQYTIFSIPQPPHLASATLQQTSSKGPGNSYNLHLSWDYAYGCPTLDHYEVQKQEPLGSGIWVNFITNISPNATGWTVGPMGIYNDFALRIRAVHNDGFITPWSNEWIIHAPVPGDPIVATVQSPEATAYSNGKKIVVDDNGTLHVTYVSGDTVMYTRSADEGETWQEKTAIGFGSNPAIELLDNGQPSICFLSENRLFRTNKLTDGWEPAQCLYQGGVTDHFNYLSYVVDRERDKSYLGWVSTNLADYSELLILPLEEQKGRTLNEPVKLDYANDPYAFKSPSLALERKGELLVAWSRSGVVRYSVDMREPEVISEPGKRCIHPIISRYGDRVTAVWQVEEPDGTKGLEPGRFTISTRTKTEFGWDEEKVIASSENGDYQYPVAAAAGQYLYAGHHGDGNYDIHYLGDYADGWETHTRNISLNSEGQSGYPCVAFSNKWPNHSLYILWTETFPESAKVIIPPVVKVVHELLADPVPSFEVYPKTNQASSYCTQRAGGLCYGAGAYRTVDYHPEELKYSFSGLDRDNRYKVKMVFYRSTGGGTSPANNWLLQPKSDQVSFGMVHLPDTTVVTLERVIPRQCLNDGAVVITVRKIKGDYAVCAALEIIEYTDGEGGKPGGVQASESNPLPATYRYELLPGTPNPFERTTAIRYQTAKPGRVSLKVYNTLGQLVRTLEDGERPAGHHSAVWDGKDQAGRAAANGVYLYRLEAGEFGQTKKMTLIR